MNAKDKSSVDVGAFRKEAGRLYCHEILGRWASAENVWRTAWVLDTLLDYFRVCRIDSAAVGDAALHALNPTYSGSWWDDFGWIGIAALRATEQSAFPSQGDAFVKIAINAWAYMYGPGWSKTSQKVYPFRSEDLPGWAEFAKCHGSNIGAPNVWKKIDQTFKPPPPTPDQKFQQQPRYAPGGAWNSAIIGSAQPVPATRYVGNIADVNALIPRQNTVTNGLYTILTLRMYQASQNPRYKKVFASSGLDADACRQAWNDQIEWLDKWMTQVAPPDQSLLLTLGNGDCLVRERVSTYQDSRSHRIYWDPAYSTSVVWIGDQGLLLGALREGQTMHCPNPLPKIFGFCPNLIGTVFKAGFALRHYGPGGSIRGDFLLPWVDLAAKNRYEATCPGSDERDYQTGVGVFMRYLLQAYQADPPSVLPYKNMILASANNIIRQGFGTTPYPAGLCDAFTPYSDDALDQLTAHINSLSVLLLAIEMNDRTNPHRSA